MSDAPEIGPKWTFEAYVDGCINCDFDGKTQDEIASELGIARSTLHLWKKKVDWGAVRDERRKRYSRHTTEVDASLIRQALKGDTRAIELYYTRFDGFIPTSKTINASDLTDDELRKRAAELGAEIDAKRRAGEGSVSPGNGEAGA